MVNFTLALGIIFLLMPELSFLSQRSGTCYASERAVSLKVLQQRLQFCQKNGRCSDLLLNFAGLTRIDGYTLDEPNHDLIVFGIVDKTAPSLHTQDFVVALRNAWGKYARREGNTLYYTNPGCSIDPDPNTVKKLNKLADRILRGDTIEDVDRGIEKWHAICKRPQKVRVLGIPFNTHFARVMVEADYYMKNLTNGSVQLGIDGFSSMIDMTMSRIKEDVVAQRPVSVAISAMNRFEFYPGENKYYDDEETVMIKQCPVQLITEAEYLSRSGQIRGTGRVDPIAKKFADDFTAHYQEIARERPIYQELEGLFRFVALAKILKYKNVRADLDYLLNDFELESEKVKPKLPGVSHLKDFEHRIEHADGYQQIKLWLPSCGGVGIDLEVTSESFEKVEASQAAQIRDRVLEMRPEPASLFWEI